MLPNIYLDFWESFKDVITWLIAGPNGQCVWSDLFQGNDWKLLQSCIHLSYACLHWQDRILIHVKSVGLGMLVWWLQKHAGEPRVC